ncbi:hypothetical protein K1719_016761 [Acacia pycnantha]|nr:hypothetical protein K1719_016761 [Acacia pycnantha]
MNMELDNLNSKFDGRRKIQQKAVMHNELVERVISKTKISHVVVKESVIAAWKVKGKLDIDGIGFNIFKFEFEFPEEATRGLDDNPLVVRHFMLALQVDTCPFWIQLHDIPPAGQMKENYILFASRIGNVVAMEDPDDNRVAAWSLSHVRIEFDVERPVVPGFLMPRPDNLWPVWSTEALMREEIGQIFQVATVDILGNYLSLLFTLGTLKIQALNFVIHKLKKRTQGWKKDISYSRLVDRY